MRNKASRSESIALRLMTVFRIRAGSSIQRSLSPFPIDKWPCWKWVGMLAGILALTEGVGPLSVKRGGTSRSFFRSGCGDSERELKDFSFYNTCTLGLPCRIFYTIRHAQSILHNIIPLPHHIKHASNCFSWLLRVPLLWPPLAVRGVAIIAQSWFGPSWQCSWWLFVGHIFALIDRPTKHLQPKAMRLILRRD